MVQDIQWISVLHGPQWNEDNEGCGGCGSGWYSVEELNGCDNIITSVSFDEGSEPNDPENDDDSLAIFVFSEDKKIKLLQVDGTYGNGYYGRGYTVRVKVPIIEQTATKTNDIIPKPFQLNERQLEIVSFIESTLGITYSGNTNKDYFAFIKDNRAKATVTHKNNASLKEPDGEDIER